MTTKRLVAGLTPFAATALLFGGCDQGNTVSIGMTLKLPQGSASLQAMELRVGDGGTCDPALGQVLGEASGDALQTFDMKRDCQGGATWCQEITLEKDDSTKVFHVVGFEGGQPKVEGCATAVINQDPLEVKITCKKFNPPPCCNDGVVQPGEQCDSGIIGAADCSGNPLTEQDVCRGINQDEVCHCDCAAREILLSTENVGPPAVDNVAGTKSELALAFSGGAGTVAGSLRAVYRDTSAATSGTSDVNLRLLKDDLFPFTEPASFTKQLRLPWLCTAPVASGPARQQLQPSIAKVSNEIVAVVYASDEQQPTVFDIKLSPLGPSGCADVPQSSDIVKLNATGGAPCEHPDVAGGPDGTALVVWSQAGAVRGRIWKRPNPQANPPDPPGGVLSPAADIEIASAPPGARPRVAGSPSGWTVVYAGGGSGDGDGIFAKTVSASGSVGAETLVNVVTTGIQDQPDVAMLEDGRACVVWRSEGGVIYFQRFDAGGNKVAGDQDRTLTVQSPPASEPAVAAGNGVFSAAWLADGPSQPGTNQVWARHVNAASGFGFNHVTGQNDDFLASHPGVDDVRGGPAIAIGGKEGYVVIGWHDQNVTNPGVFVRRFPKPE